MRISKRFFSNSVEIHRLGHVNFSNAFNIQKTLISDPIYSSRDHLIFVEHSPVYTCGRRHFKDVDQYINNDKYNCNQDSIDKFKNEIEKIDRGGNITFHGNGQLVIYPIFDLRKEHLKKDLYWYLRTMEDVIIDLLLNEYNLKTDYNFECYHDEQYTGVWVKNDDDIKLKDKQYKICAIGIGVSRWKTFHGLSFNINTDLNHFDKIIPCGISESNKSVINLMDIIDNSDSNLNENLTVKNNNRQFNHFTNNMIDKLIVLFEKHFNVSCLEEQETIKEFTLN
eukprot:106282_1